MRPLYRELASLVCARQNCAKSGNSEWHDRHTERIEELVRNHMPSGSGIDSGTHLDLDKSSEDRLVFRFGYHHMNDCGIYDGWTEHKAIVIPSLQFGFHLNITGRDRNDIKDYLHDVFSAALSEEVGEPVAK